MPSPQTLSEDDRRAVALWATACAERVLPLFEAEAADDGRPRDAIARARAFGRGELTVAVEIRRRFVAGRAAGAVRGAAAVEVREALRGLPLLGEDSAGPLGTGLLASPSLAAYIRTIQTELSED